MCGKIDEDVSEVGEGGEIVYSPFGDKKGNPLELSKIRFSHLGQLRTVDEGYKVEYKSTFDKSVKDKIPAIITSFANSEGGWLIIGIDDNSHEVTCIPKIRSDYSQTISQLLKERTSPIPVFDSRFIQNPKNKGEGVLVVEIYEGKFSPYVANGTPNSTVIATNIFLLVRLQVFVPTKNGTGELLKSTLISRGTYPAHSARAKISPALLRLRPFSSGSR